MLYRGRSVCFYVKKLTFLPKTNCSHPYLFENTTIRAVSVFPKKQQQSDPWYYSAVLYTKKNHQSHCSHGQWGGGHFNNNWGVMTYSPKKLMTRKLWQGVVKKQTQIYTIITWQQKSKNRPVLQSKFDRNFKNFTPRKSNFWNCRSNFDCNGGVFQGCKKTKTNIYAIMTKKVKKEACIIVAIWRKI